ncbi:hypothetical protein MPTK1_1g04950 [Marchantia polymorpha subsp. ruderalis]|uniref:Uncharacterized protein n=2 Tax=Marchantia polymorpha TaxID=3197 RepID=A0AAF6ALL7_MARPO|nr:hypothetical protein MARPO_0005s0114 [Marchantia polymorpha]BBM97337.1 hypothetical protein Mp_1g04950 [Marchantia polymorpha subsp. ruderalis]|eukprot:PTQ48471.1 hypothetical protein MARPO_0005s0114 [Marchantia polymorpha]
MTRTDRSTLCTRNGTSSGSWSGRLCSTCNRTSAGNDLRKESDVSSAGLDESAFSSLSDSIVASIPPSSTTSSSPLPSKHQICEILRGSCS